MLKTLTEWAVRKLLVAKIEQLEQRALVVLAEAWHRNNMRSKTDVQFTRILLSGDERQEVTGTESQITAAAARMASRTKSCVTVAVAVAYHHRRGCADRRSGGFDTVGN